LADYIFRKIAMFQVSSSANGEKPMPLDGYVQQTLAECILIAQEFCETRLGNFLFFCMDKIEIDMFLFFRTKHSISTRNSTLFYSN
jgi:hypothetical protein